MTRIRRGESPSFFMPLEELLSRKTKSKPCYNPMIRKVLYSLAIVSVSMLILFFHFAILTSERIWAQKTIDALLCNRTAAQPSMIQKLPQW
jgi:hypothetical protein